MKQFLHGVRDRGGVVNTTITLAAAKGILLVKNANLLIENGGHIDLTKEWGLSNVKPPQVLKIDPEVLRTYRPSFSVTYTQ